MTLVAAVAQGLLMKPSNQSLPFKTRKLTDHWTGVWGVQTIINPLCGTISVPNPNSCQHTHTRKTHTLHFPTYCLKCSNWPYFSPQHTHIHQCFTLLGLYLRLICKHQCNIDGCYQSINTGAKPLPIWGFRKMATIREPLPFDPHNKEKITGLHI